MMAAEGEIGADYSPRLSAFSPGLCFLHSYIAHCQQKWCGEIGPQGFSIEISPLTIVASTF